MKIIWRITVALAVLAGATACWDGTGGLPDAGFLLRGARAASGDVTSAHVEMSASAPVPGLAARTFSADVRAPHKSEPGASVGAADIVLGANRSQRVEFVERDSQLYTKSASGKFNPAPKLSGAGELPIPSTLLDPERGLARMLANISDARTEVRETIDGVLAFRVTGTVPRADAQVWLPTIREDARLTVWFAATGRHLPVGTRLTVPGADGAPVTIDFALSDLNRKVSVPAID
ncbi:LppX_LprAFG lipoprotein [Nocardia inohanensis]|uniref:LppX_LprAFG lipoprotein n=1 Tax=Nocardia inohanensis TaxID=209246 RepID=UPI00082AC2D2|nr:LppX_LprAFG lipoprotein [Nocardia inohanensis]